MKRAIITGATGTIGNALVRKLISENIEVVVIANPESKRIDLLPQSELISVRKCSLSELDSLSDIGECDAFFHLGWIGTIGPDRNDMYLQNLNVKYSLDAVKLASRCGCKVFVGAGSQAEYGKVEGKMSAYTPANPQMGYGIAKLCAGQMTRILCNQVGIKHIWTRILSIYGPNDGNMTMISSSIGKMLRGEIPEFSKGEQLWDFLYCDDAANALYLCALYGKEGAIYPIGSGQAKPLKEYIVEMRTVMSEVMEKEIEIKLGVIPYNENQTMYLCADITELSHDTGFIPKISFAEGIKFTIIDKKNRV